MREIFSRNMKCQVYVREQCEEEDRFLKWMEKIGFAIHEMI